MYSVAVAIVLLLFLATSLTKDWNLIDCVNLCFNNSGQITKK